ncbi:hypothetical protein CR513_49830, partial [Mucuna pruriens]
MAIAQIPKYTKFLKEVIYNKRKLGEFGIVELNEECFAIVLKKLPSNLQDLGSFTIPCTIGNSTKRALCDLGASINLMTIAHPRGVIGDVLVKVDKFIFPTNFMVMEKDEEVLVILG